MSAIIWDRCSLREEQVSFLWMIEYGSFNFLSRTVASLTGYSLATEGK